MLNNTFKNHIYVVFDSSGSMSSLMNKAIQVFNTYIDILRVKSLKYEQETRISFYDFNSRATCKISDVDVARPMKLEHVSCDGMTALFDAMELAIHDSKTVSQKYGDHSFIFYIITDGAENNSRCTATQIKNTLKNLDNNYTVTALVPDNSGVRDMKYLGIPEGNIMTWETTLEGVESFGRTLEASTENFMQARSTGQRSTTKLFSSLTEVDNASAKKILTKVDKKKYIIINNKETVAQEIRPLVLASGVKEYKTGNSFYQLVKNETIQPTKQIMIQNKKTNEVYEGDNARKLLNLPDTSVKFKLSDFGEWDVYVQSTSVNRKIIPKQGVLIKV